MFNYKSITALILYTTVLLFLFGSCINDGRTAYEKGKKAKGYTGKRQESKKEGRAHSTKKRYKSASECEEKEYNDYTQDISEQHKSYFCNLIDEYGDIEQVRLRHLPDNEEELAIFLYIFFVKKGIYTISPYSLLHTNRNKYNIVPKNETQIVKISNDPLEYKDNKGGYWTKVIETYHGNLSTYRGIKNRAGCQVCFLPENGKIDDKSNLRGTFDYGFFILQTQSRFDLQIFGTVDFLTDGLHKQWDITPHNGNNNYIQKSQMYD